jgi:flagellar biosynthesis regulator FlaF
MFEGHAREANFYLSQREDLLTELAARRIDLIHEIRQLQDETMMEITDRAHRNTSVRTMMTDCSASHEMLSKEERLRMHSILGLEELYEELLSLGQAPFHRAQVLLERTGAFDVVRGRAHVEHFYQHSTRWFPFVAFSHETTRLSEFEYKRGLIKDFLFSDGVGRAPECNPRRNANSNCGYWRMNAGEFEDCLFNPENRLPPYHDPGELGVNVFKYLLKNTLGQQERDEWNDFLELTQIIEDCELEDIYRTWLDYLIREEPDHFPHTPDQDKQERVDRLQELFKRGSFHPSFVRYFLSSLGSLGYVVSNC